MKNDKKFNVEKRAKEIEKINNLCQKIVKLLNKLPMDDRGFSLSLSIRSEGNTFSNIAILNGTGDKIVHSLKYALNQDNDFSDLIGIASLENEIIDNPMIEFMELMGEITDGFSKNKKERVNKEKKKTQKN